MNFILILLLMAAIVAAAALAAALLGLRRERSRLAAIIGLTVGESLESAAGRLHGEAQRAAAVPELSARYGELIQNCPIAVICLDENLMITGLSDRAAKELDQPRPRRHLLESLESHELEGAVTRAVADLRPAEITLRLYAAGRRPYLAKIVPYRAGDAKECLVFLQDVAATVDFGELRSQFAATVSHELRTPLAGIRAMVETLRDPAIKPEDQRRFLERVDRETNRLAQLIDEILFLSSLESGAANLEGESDLAAVAASEVEKLGPLAENRQVKVTSRLPASLVVPLPERMASVVISNLLENALKYSGRGSRVEIEGGKEGASWFAVRDDGIGIDAEHLPHIFERFYRVDKSRSRRLGGTGLGLSIVKHVVESAGGTVTAISREGFGTEIRVSFPAGRARGRGA